MKRSIVMNSRGTGRGQGGILNVFPGLRSWLDLTQWEP